VVAGFGEVAILSLEIIRVGAGPPEANNLGDNVFGVPGIARSVALTALVPFERLQKALNAANLGCNAAGENRPHPGNGGQLSDLRVGGLLGGVPLIDLLELGFEEADVSQGQFQDALDGEHQVVIEGKAFGSRALQLAGVLKRIGEVMAAEFGEMSDQLRGRERSQIVESGLLREHQAAGDAKDVRERFYTAIVAGFEEQKGRDVRRCSPQSLGGKLK